MEWHASCYIKGEGRNDKGVRWVGPMKFYFDNLAYKLWLQDIMKQFVLTVRPGTNKWYLSHWPI